MLLLISYDQEGAQTRGNKHAQLDSAIKQVAPAAGRPMFSQWLVQTDDPVDVWGNRLTPLMDNDDRLLIVRVQGRVNGWLPSSWWEWINARV